MVEYSNVITLQFIDYEKIYDIRFTPNPLVDDFTLIHINTPKQELLDIILFDQLGRLVYQQEIETRKGLNQIQLILEDLANGSYYLLLKTGDFSSNKLLQICR